MKSMREFYALYSRKRLRRANRRKRRGYRCGRGRRCRERSRLRGITDLNGIGRTGDMAGLKAVMGIKEAREPNVAATVVLEVKATRRFIWMMKIRAIWAVIRAKPLEPEHE